MPKDLEHHPRVAVQVGQKGLQIQQVDLLDRFDEFLDTFAQVAGRNECDVAFHPVFLVRFLTMACVVNQPGRCEH